MNGIARDSCSCPLSPLGHWRQACPAACVAVEALGGVVRLPTAIASKNVYAASSSGCSGAKPLNRHRGHGLPGDVCLRVGIETLRGCQCLSPRSAPADIELPGDDRCGSSETSLGHWRNSLPHPGGRVEAFGRAERSTTISAPAHIEFCSQGASRWPSASLRHRWQRLPSLRLKREALSRAQRAASIVQAAANI